MRSRALSLVLPTLLLLAACGTPAPVMEKDTPASSAAAETETLGKLDIDYSTSTITFTGKSSIIDHEGSFKTFTVTIDQDETTPSDLEKAVFAVEIDLASIETDAAGLTAHLAKADFFDTTSYPKATFKSMRVTKLGGNQYSITGDMTVKGVTKPLTMTATVTKSSMNASFNLNRQAYGIGNDSYGNKLLDAEVPVNAKIMFVRP